MEYIRCTMGEQKIEIVNEIITGRAKVIFYYNTLMLNLSLYRPLPGPKYTSQGPVCPCDV